MPTLFNKKDERSSKLESSASASGLSGFTSFTSGNTKETEERYNDQQKKIRRTYNSNNTRRVWVGRCAVIVSLLAVASLLGYLSYRFLHASERDMAEAEYHAKIGRTLNLLTTISKNKLHGCYAVSKVTANFNPDASTWPLISVPGYYDFLSDITPTSLVGGMSIAPMVTDDKLVEFESFAADFYAKQFPNETVAESSFGFGIFMRDSSLNKTLVPDQRSWRTNTTSPWGSPYNFVSPKFLHSKGNHNLLLMDSHATRVHGTAVDGAYNCSLQRAQAENYEDIGCQTVSEMVPPSSKKRALGPGAFIVTPIYPANDPTLMKGLIFAKINWIEILQAVQLDDVSGIDAIISTSKEVFTYSLVDGDVEFAGEGDLSHCHDENLQDEIQFLDSSSLSNASVVYTMKFCVNPTFYDQYYTHNPTVAAVTIVLIILFTSLFFILYDFLVRREFSAKQELLTAKRQFVRFVSHEVRTPLNSVVMGLTLLQEELAQTLRCFYGHDPEAGELPEGSDSSKSSQAGTREETSSDEDASTKQKGPGMARVSSWYRFAEEVQVNAQSSVDVLNDLLNYDKVEARTLALELTPVNIWELITQTAQEFRLPAARKEIQLDVTMPSVGATSLLSQKAVGDVIRLTQVLRNLISNAIKFTPTGGSIQVHANLSPCKKKNHATFEMRNKHNPETFEQSGFLELQVKDSGAGMTKDQLKNLFKQGIQFNVNELQAGNGSGLGLFIAKGIIEQHQGTMTADSRGLGKGTAFTMILPVYQMEDSAQLKSTCDSVTANELTHSAMEQQPSLKMLVVDDSASNRKLLTRLLTNRGHSCDGAENGQEGVDKVREALASGHPYDIVLLDYEMPVMDGPTAAKTIRSHNIDVFLVGVTGNMLAEDVEFFKGNGANAVLPKPFKVAHLEELCMEYDIGGANDDPLAASHAEQGTPMVRVESGGRLVELGDELAKSLPRSSEYDFGLDIDI